jgi:signal transduction histidine kinase
MRDHDRDSRPDPDRGARPGPDRDRPVGLDLGTDPDSRDRQDSPLIRRILPPLQIVSLVCLALAVLEVVTFGSPWSGWMISAFAAYAAAAPAVAVLWAARARARTARARASLSVIVAVLLLPVAVLGSLGFTLPVVLVAVALIVVDIGRRAGWIVAVAVALAGAALHLTSGSGLLVALINSLPVTVLLGFGIALGSALRAYEAAHDADRRLIAERDEALARLEEAIQQMRRTAAMEKELLLAEERARSARDLHDGLGHRLTLISMSLEFARRSRAVDADAAWGEIAVADTTAREALTEMRTWVRAKSPVREAEAGSIDDLDAIAESFRGTGLDVVVSPRDPGLALTDEASMALYRAVQEGLTNALRHGESAQVRISVGVEDHWVVLRLVGDLGADVRGRVPEGEAQRGFGLRSLADRAAALGGDLRAAREGDGFVLVMRLAAEQAVQRGAEDEGRLGPDGRSGDGPAPANGDGPAPATGADDDAAATLREVAG